MYLLFHLLTLCLGCCFYQIITPCIDPLIFPLNFTEQSLLVCGQASGPAGGFSIDPSRPLHTTFHPHHLCDSKDALSAPDSETFNSTGPPVFCSQAFTNPDLLMYLNPKAPQLNTSVKLVVDHFNGFSNILLRFFRSKTGHKSVPYALIVN